MKIIADPIYGYIEVPDEYLPLLSHPYLQRLRRIKQLAFVYLVYPSANHTRFEHSLGVMHVAREMARSLELDEDLYAISGLLHDVGHGPFSHASEEILKHLTGESHEKHGVRKIREIKDLISDLGLDYKKVLREITGKGVGIVAGDLDADRIDYIQRDAYFTGNRSVSIDFAYLLRNMELTSRGVVVNEKAIPVVENILISRSLMYRTVYFHKTKIAALVLFIEIVKELLNKGFSAGKIYEMDDYDFISTARREKTKYIDMLDNRRLPKLVYSIPLSKIEGYDFDVYQELLDELRAKVGEDVFVYPLSSKSPKLPEKIKVLYEGRIKRLVEVSEVTRYLNYLEEQSLLLRVYSFSEDRDVRRKISRIVSSYLRRS